MQRKHLQQCLMGRLGRTITFLNVLLLSDYETVEYVCTDLSSLSPSLCKMVSVTSCQNSVISLYISDFVVLQIQDISNKVCSEENNSCLYSCCISLTVYFHMEL